MACSACPNFSMGHTGTCVESRVHPETSSARNMSHPLSDTAIADSRIFLVGIFSSSLREEKGKGERGGRGRNQGRFFSRGDEETPRGASSTWQRSLSRGGGRLQLIKKRRRRRRRRRMRRREKQAHDRRQHRSSIDMSLIMPSRVCVCVYVCPPPSSSRARAQRQKECTASPLYYTTPPCHRA